jgi:hypothetical protein
VSVALPLLERWESKVEPEPNTGCWLWVGHIQPNGYGTIRTGSLLSDSRAMSYAHRVAYKLLVGPVPVGLQVDHLCRVRQCVNPAHLEPVSPAVNTGRGSSPSTRTAREGRCQRGHDLTAENIKVRSNGKRSCRRCINLRKTVGWARRTRV